MLSVLAAARQVTSQREETEMCFQKFEFSNRNCKECSSLLADRRTSQYDLEKLESTDCEYDSEGEGPQLGSDYQCKESRLIMYFAS